MSVYEKKFVIRYSEVDKNNEITPISVVKYFQEIGCLHSDSLGVGLEGPVGWVIIQWKVKLLSTDVKWNDEIIVKTWPSGIVGPYFLRDYEMYKADKLIAIGTSKWVLTDANTHNLMKQNDEIINKFSIVNKKTFNTSMIKLKPEEKFTKKMIHKVDFTDLDTNEHVNNIKYIELAYSMLPEKADYIEIMYKHATLLGEDIECFLNDGLVTIKNGDKLSAIVKFRED